MFFSGIENFLGWFPSLCPFLYDLSRQRKLGFNRLGRTSLEHREFIAFFQSQPPLPLIFLLQAKRASFM